MQDYHKIRAWQAAHVFAIRIRELSQKFPRRGYARLKDQLLRSSEAIADLISEGCGAATNLEQARFLDMAIKSCSEAESQLDKSHGFRLINDRDWRSHTDEVREVRKMTWGFRNAVLKRVDSPGQARWGADKARGGKTATGKRAVTGERKPDAGERAHQAPDSRPPTLTGHAPDARPTAMPDPLRVPP